MTVNPQVIGIDPSSSATGCVWLELLEDRGRWGVNQVLGRKTLRPKGGTLGEKMSDLARQLTDLIQEQWGPYPAALHVVVEDPTDFGQRAGRAGGAQGKVGAAFGAVMATLPGAMSGAWGARPITCVPSQQWIPRTRTRNRSHPMKHKQARRLLRTFWPALEACTDDETFAAGVAMYATSGHALAAV